MFAIVLRSLSILCACVIALGAHAQGALDQIMPQGDLEQGLVVEQDAWLNMPDLDFAQQFGWPMAFGPDSNQDSRSLLAWMYFARLVKSAQPDSGQTMEWMTWHTNNETFTPTGSEAAANRSHLAVSKAKRARAASAQTSASSNSDISCPQDFPPQAVTRNDISYDYLSQDLQLYSISALADYLNEAEGNRIDAPVGSIGVKGVFLAKECVPTLNGTPGSTGPLNYGAQAVWDNVQVDADTTDTIPMTGLHLMAKLQPTPEDPFTSNTPSWFWATFELNTNPGLDNVLSMITGRDTLPPDAIALITGLIAEIGDPRLVNYRLSGTQIQFTQPDGGVSVLGNSKLENFAGGGITEFPQFKTPETWTVFTASCHACHSTAAFVPASQVFFAESRDLNQAFPLVVGALPPSILDTLRGSGSGFGGYDYQQLDFLWPITFQFLGQE